jgi:DeoR/GlpR family transcriptional regulator of sugar metabolism
MSEDEELPGRPYEEFAAFNLTSEERRDRIIQVLREQDEVSVTELSQRLGVSEVTTRKDLQQLEEQGYLTRVRGGAVVSGRGQLELRFAARQQVNLEEKRPHRRARRGDDPAWCDDLS